MAGGRTVTLAAATSLTAVVRKDAAVQKRFDLPASFGRLPAAGRDVGSVTYWADGVRLGTVRLVAAGSRRVTVALTAGRAAGCHEPQVGDAGRPRPGILS